MGKVALFITTVFIIDSAIASYNHPQSQLLPQNVATNRRSMLVSTSMATCGILLPGSCRAAASSSLLNRLESDILYQPKPSRASELDGVDNTYYPDFLQGEWDVIQTLRDMATPLGVIYIGGPNASQSIAEASLKQARQQIDIPINLKLRFLPTKWGVAEDRLFNNRQRFNAFAGRDVVSSVNYADVGGSNRPSVLKLGGSDRDPLQTVLIRFKGPAAQKTFVTCHASENVSPNSSWVGHECNRSIFALTNTDTSPPVTTDTENIWFFESIGDGKVRGRLRIASYLNAQTDKLFFDAKNRAVSIQDYTLDMTKVN